MSLVPPPRSTALRWALGAAIQAALIAASTTPALADKPQAAKVVSVGALLRDDGALKSWIEQHNADVLAADARIAEARADHDAARIPLQNPTFDATLGGIVLGASNPRGLGFGDTGNISFGLTQTFELGKYGPRVEAAKLRVDASRRLHEQTIVDRVADGRAALARVAHLKARLAAIEDNLTGARRVTDLEKSRFENGALSGNDYDRLVLDAIALEADVARARAELTAAIAACNAALYGTCDPTSVTPADIDASAPLPPSPPAGAVEKRPDVIAARLEASAAEQDAILARRRVIPDPSVRIGYTRDQLVVAGSQPNLLSIGISIPLPIFDQGRYDAARALARASEQRFVARAVVVGAEANLSGLLAKESALATAAKTFDTAALPRSSGVLDATSLAFSRGQVSMTDLLLARRTHLALVLSRMDVRFDLFSVRNDIRRALGLDAQLGSAAPPPSLAKAQP